MDVPARRYTDAVLAARERTHVFGRAWLAACPSFDLDRAGAYRVVELAGRSIALVRGRAGAVRALDNTCRHRGTHVLAGSGHTGATITCPYHGWRYGLDGALEAAPGFDGAPHDRCALRKVRHRSAVGFEWICLDPDAPSLEDFLGPVLDHLRPYRLEEMRPIRRRRVDVGCNWKAVLDNSLESYHIDTVHPRSIGPLMGPGRQRFSSLGDHLMSVVRVADWAGRAWLDARTSRGGPYTADQRHLLHRFLVFPNLLLNVLPCQVGIFQAWPETAQTATLDYTFCGRRGATGLEWLRTRASALLSLVLLAEDLPVLPRFQEGVAASDLTRHHLHREEAPIAHHHAAIDRWIEDEP